MYLSPRGNLCGPASRAGGVVSEKEEGNGGSRSGRLEERHGSMALRLAQYLQRNAAAVSARPASRFLVSPASCIARDVRTNASSKTSGAGGTRQKIRHTKDTAAAARSYSQSDPRRTPPMDRKAMYKLLNLKDFSEEETDASFASIAKANAAMSLGDIETYLRQRYQQFDEERTQLNSSHLPKLYRRAQLDARSIHDLLLEYSSGEGGLTRSEYQKAVSSMAREVDYTTLMPLSASLLLVGTSVGIISPIMPFVAEKLAMSTTHYGVVVSSFALSKMAGNIPSAILVERHGRKPYLVHSLLVVGLGVAGMGIASDWIQLSACRMTVGLGVAALTTASTLAVADVSTNLSRASTYSPLMSSFAAGMALGPAVGGILHDSFGIRDTFFLVSTSYAMASLWNQLSVSETKRDGEWWEKNTLPWHDEYDDDRDHSRCTEERKPASLATTISDSLKDTSKQWRDLISDSTKVRPIIIMNGFYNLAFSGAQMTLLPLLLTGGGDVASDAAIGLALSASTLGQLYMWMSFVQVVANPAAGRFADRMGKSVGIVAGGALTSLAISSVPIVCAHCFLGNESGLLTSDTDWALLAGTLGVWSLGSTLLATSHVAAISDVVEDSRRSQALALLRTAGDVGYLVGAIGAGFSADLFQDVGLAMQASGLVLLGGTAWFGNKTFNK